MNYLNHSCVTTATPTCTIFEKLYLQKFFIQVFDEKKSCEECGVVYKPLYNFYMIACCGPAMRVCNICNWDTVPCKSCKENDIGDIVISKKINSCVACKDEKEMKKLMEKNI